MLGVDRDPERETRDVAARISALIDTMRASLDELDEIMQEGDDD